MVGVIRGEEDRVLDQTQMMSHYHQPKKLENCEDQILDNNNNNPSPNIEAHNFVDVVKQEVSNIRDQSLILQAAAVSTSPHHTNKFLNFSCDSNIPNHNNNQHAPSRGGGGPDRSAEV